jgi:hypothetical protein
LCGLQAKEGPGRTRWHIVLFTASHITLER